jgi:cell division protein FtsB
MAPVTDGHRTASIPRPKVGAPRGAARPKVRPSDRAADAVVQDDPVRIARHGRSRFALGVLATVIVAAIAAALVVLPARAWMNQRAELDAKRSELATLENANDDLAGDIDRLQTPEGIEDAARVELGYQMEGETRVATLDTPPAPTDLPKGWPYSMVKQILRVRSGAR